ncbi:MAG: Asp-tRNA(Asn)/Glu-tRNA(Gln) amidotransferase subunit GatC [Elusimicrobia bacterium]|nr:Asp-tRNA(Asn)/Glu-tRNA(Gln) amidotransferase subunit GatC [Elusimicrobiota bacterium]
MPIEEEDVRHIARLARLELTDDEVRLYQGQLGRILASMEELRRVDTAQVPATAHVLGLTDVLRPDEPRPFAHRDDLLANAPRREGPYFKVPKVLAS